MSDALRNAIRMLELPAKSEEAGQIAIKAKVKPEPAEVPMPLNTATFTRTVKPEPTEASLPGTVFKTANLANFVAEALRL